MLWDKACFFRGRSRKSLSMDIRYVCGVVVNQRRLPNYSSGSSWGVELYSNLMFAAASRIIVRWESLYMES